MAFATAVSFAFLASIQAGPIRVACLGDSITSGGPGQANYPTQLQQMLGSRYEVRNFGVSGKTALEEGDWPLWNQNNYLLARSYRPNVVVVMLGTNDAWHGLYTRLKDDFVTTYKRHLNELVGLPTKPKVFVMLPPPMFSPVPEARIDDFEQGVVPLEKQIAREMGLPVIDLHQAFAGKRNLLSDGVHPTAEGYAYLARQVALAVDAPALKASWKVVYCDSEEADEGPAKNAIDGDPESYWHTNYSTRETKHPHELQVDLGRVGTFSGIRYLPRQDGENGRVAKYEVYGSLDGKNWGQPLAAGTFPDGADPVDVMFRAPVRMKFLRFVALSEIHGNSWASIAELDVIPG